MAGTRSNTGPGVVSQKLDTLSCDLIESALDSLAKGEDFGVIAAYETDGDTRETQVFDEDSPELCIEEARRFIRQGKGAVRYGVVYDGAVAQDSGAFLDAVILEFGEKGSQSAYSGYVLYENAGSEESFAWADPEPAGELDLLV